MNILNGHNIINLPNDFNRINLPNDLNRINTINEPNNIYLTHILNILNEENFQNNNGTNIFVNALNEANILNILNGINQHPPNNTGEINEWIKENKKLNGERNTKCPIKMETIGSNEEYCTCKTCAYNFDYESLNNWLKSRKECPMCRASWTNNVVYTNKWI